MGPHVGFSVIKGTSVYEKRSRLNSTPTSKSYCIKDLIQLHTVRSIIFS